jgi:uncharacterized protein YndB with AHSA1/START domain
VAKAQYDVLIGRSPQDVFDYITRVETYAEWQRKGGIQKVDRLTDGPIAVGSRFRMDRSMGGRTASIDCTVSAFEPGRRFDFTSLDTSGFRGVFSTTLTPEGAGTRLNWDVAMQPPNLLYRLLDPMIGREIRKSAAVDFPELKRTLESVA